MTSTARRKRTPLQRVKIFDAHGGICCECGQKIRPGEPWHLAHIKGLCDGGTDDDDNLAPAHERCNMEKAWHDEKPRTSKADRQRAFHVTGRSKPRRGRPMPGTRASGWKQRIGGNWERRT